VTRSCHYAWALCLLRSPDWSENIARLLRDTRETGDQDRDRRINWASPGQCDAGGWPAEVPTFRLRASHAAITRSRISSFELADRRQDVNTAIFELQIALIALDHGATDIWRHDQNFVSVPGLPVHDPLPRRRRG
jgi:hypothetical protein